MLSSVVKCAILALLAYSPYLKLTEAISVCGDIICENGAACRSIDGVLQCVCPTVCGNTVKRVCGSDGKTYDNICQLQIATCKSNGVIVKVSNGKCSKKLTTTSTTTPEPTSTSEAFDTSSTQAPTTTTEVPSTTEIPETTSSTTEAPTTTEMGTSTTTETPSTTTTESPSPKRTTKRPAKIISCSKYCTKKCASNQASPFKLSGRCKSKGKVIKAPRCKCKSKLCPDICTALFLPVCGSDGVTYPNECELNMMSCKNKNPVFKVFDGPCPPRNCTGDCQRGVNPVCGSDGRTYINQCVLNKVACLKRQQISVISSGLCSSESLGIPSCTGICGLFCAGKPISKCLQGGSIIDAPLCDCALKTLPSCSGVCSLVCKGVQVNSCLEGGKVIKRQPCFCPLIKQSF